MIDSSTFMGMAIIFSLVLLFISMLLFSILSFGYFPSKKEDMICLIGGIIIVLVVIFWIVTGVLYWLNGLLKLGVFR